MYDHMSIFVIFNARLDFLKLSNLGVGVVSVIKYACSV